MQHLLLLHGALGSTEQLMPLSAFLSEQFKIHTLDFTGHGHSEEESDSFSIELFSKQVLTYLDENAIDKINLFGYSMGGYVSLYFANHHPERVNKVVTLATKFLWTPAIAQQETKMLNPEKIIEKIPAFAYALEKRHFPHDWKRLLQKTAGMMKELGDHPPLNDPDFEQVPHPVLLSIGDKDSMVTLEETIHIFRKLKNANLLVLPNTTHPIEKTNIKKLASEIAIFLEETTLQPYDVTSPPRSV